MTLPQLAGRPMVTDGGMETDLIFHHGLELPEFAAFPLLDDAEGRAHLTEYYDGYAAIAREAGAGLMLEGPTWRANPDWGAKLGYDADALTRVNAASIAFLRSLAERYALPDTVVSGVIGPRGDGYVSDDAPDPDEAAEYHRPQLAAFADAGADLATVLTLTTPGEAVGLVRAAYDVGLPIEIGYTVETDGRLPDGSTLADAVAAVDDAAYVVVNCAHPTHVAHAVDRGAWQQRVVGFRPNASTLSHAELDDAEELDEGDVETLVATHRSLAPHFPNLTVVGGCCGTDARHVAALWRTG